MRDWPGAQFPFSEPFRGDDLSTAEALARHSLDLAALGEDPDWHSRTTFAFVARGVRAETPSAADVASAARSAANSWVAETALPAVEELNRQRVTRALPPAPEFKPSLLRSCVVVLTEATLWQGTAFSIGDGRYVSCAHCVRSATVAFAADDPAEVKFPVTVRRIDHDIDLAEIEIPGLDRPALTLAPDEPVKVMSPIAVIGFPNHNRLDEGSFKPGNVTAFRKVLGVERMLTNAGIVRGMSGGPAISASGHVIGVAVTGADRGDVVDATENHGLIPISAFDRLGLVAV